MIPAEAVAAIRLLWGYYLAHILAITLIMWVWYALMPKLKYAMLGTLFTFGMVFVVELWQATFPQLGDASWDDIVLGATTVIICYVAFTTIRLAGGKYDNNTNITKKASDNKQG